jgi:signal transduction histidine kinase
MEETTEHIIPVRTDIKLLIVDDREDNLISIETILEKDGYIIRTADSGRAALRVLLKESDFTLILMDVQMPGLNGFETATLIYERDKLKHIPIIFVTANDYGEDSVFKGYKMGGVDYIYKPINADLLRAKVGVFVELYKKNHELYAQEQETAAANKRLEKEIQDRIRSEAKVKLLNKQLLENISNLETTNAELERFAYVASHDLQEPLRKIILFSDQVAAKYKHQLNDEGQDYIMRIMKAADRMRMLIKNILTYSKSAVNSQDLEETDLNKLVDEILSDLEISIEQKKAIFSIEALPTLHIMPGQLRQVFQNLILNALKFSKDGRPPEIHIYTDVSYVQNDLHNEAYCNIYVKDNGIGFEQKYADDIFTLFKRLNSKDTFEGTGIGLSICKKIIEQHKGFISATSMVDEGTTFTISLPLKEVQSN